MTANDTLATMSVSTLRAAVVANGFADGPAQALRDFLVARGATVVTVFHPLTPGGGRRHEVLHYAGGELVRRRSFLLPLGPPFSFAIDPFVPLRMPHVDYWFGFNCVACTRGLVARRSGAAGRVVYWCVDFVPERFGSGMRTRLYEALDRLCCRTADRRVELAAVARDARNARYGLVPARVAPVSIVPMGAWTDRVPKVGEEGWRRRRVVFLGHLVSRQGVSLLLDALAILQSRGAGVSATVIGGGPLESDLRRAADRLGLAGAVTFSGFLGDHREVEKLLAEGSLAVAPYVPTPETFTRFADPGKLKAYMAAGLPILLTDVPPNAKELEASAGAEVVRFDAAAFAEAIERGLADQETWRRRRSEALLYARRYDWSSLFTEALSTLGHPA